MMDAHAVPSEAPREEAWEPIVEDGSTSDRQLVIISRQQRRHSPLHRGENVMEARFARFIVRDAIKHHAQNLPHLFRIEPANETERARSGRQPLSEETKTRLRAARRAKIELRETVRLADDDSAELHSEATAGAEENEGDTAMSNLSKNISDGVKSLKGKKSKSSAPKKAAPKSAKKAAEKKPKREWFAVGPTGTKSEPFSSILAAAKSVGFKGSAARVIKSQHYTVTVGEKLYTIITPEAAKRDNVAL